MNVSTKIRSINLIPTLLILLGLSIRLLVSTLPGFQIDVTAWFAWAQRLNSLGFSSFYSDNIWTNYTPGFLYILAGLGYVKNYFYIPDNLFYLMLKLPSILAEIFLGFVVFKIISKKSFIWAIIASSLILFNPAFIFNSSIWGQIDGLLSLFLFLSVYYLNKRRLILSSVIFGLSFLIKPQSIGLVPLFIVFLFQNRSYQNVLKIILPFVLIAFSFSLPFFQNQIYGLPLLFLKMTSDYSYTSLFAYNLWGAVGFWIPDSKYVSSGLILLISYWFITCLYYFRKKIDLYSFSALLLLGFYFLPTRAHERYLYPSLVFLIISAALFRSQLLVFLVSILSFIHFLNLYFVYVYYNEFYLKMPKILYQPVLYKLLEDNGRNLSIISTLIFIIITFVYIKLYAKKS